MCVCVCVCVYEYMCVYVCVIVFVYVIAHIVIKYLDWWNSRYHSQYQWSYYARVTKY